jgi:hypothetical protein
LSASRRTNARSTRTPGAASITFRGSASISAARRSFRPGRKAVFSTNFRDAAKTKPYEEITVFQDFYRLPDGRWRFCAYLEREDDFIVQETYRTQPMAAMRFYRWPGEAYGRGPVLFALPTIKTVNKAQELTLKAAAIQLLGIWGFPCRRHLQPRHGARRAWRVLADAVDRRHSRAGRAAARHRNGALRRGENDHRRRAAPDPRGAARHPHFR